MDVLVLEEKSETVKETIKTRVVLSGRADGPGVTLYTGLCLSLPFMERGIVNVLSRRSKRS